MGRTHVPITYLNKPDGTVGITGSYDTFIVDADLCPLIAKSGWYKNKAGYMMSSGNYESIPRLYYQHWLVVGKPIKGFVIDHVNGNKADNRRANLRVVTQSANMNNTAKAKNAHGVCYNKARNKWMAYYRKDGKHINLGRYETEEGAIQARQQCLGGHNYG